MTNDAKKKIHELYATHSNKEIAAITGLTVKQIENYVYRHNQMQYTPKLLKKKESI